MPSPSKIKELRVRVSTTFNSNFTNGAASTWNVVDSNALKLRVQDYDDGGLAQDGIADETLQTRMYTKNDPIPGLSKGALKFSFFAGSATGANINTTPTEAIMVNAFLGGIVQCMNHRQVGIGAASEVNAITVASANSYAAAGQAVLIGKKGDAKGCGEVKPVTGANTTHVWLGIACNAAPASGDPISFSTTTFLDETTAQSYVDTYSIGHATADHRQTIGGMGGIKLKGTSGAALPPFSKAIGVVHIGDYGSNARVTYRGGDLAFDPGIAYEEVPGAHGVNGVAGSQKVPGVPTGECTLLTDEDMPGLMDDFAASTAKTIVMQFGHEAGRCMAVEFPKAYLSGAPVSAAINNLHAVKLKFFGSEAYNSTAVQSSSVRIHMF